MDIAELLAFSVKNTASDLHLSSGLPPMIRVDGDIRRLNMPALDNRQLSDLIYSTMRAPPRRDFEANLEVDFSYSVPGLARFRVNCFHHDRGVGAAFRTIPAEVWTLEDLAAPSAAAAWAAVALLAGASVATFAWSGLSEKVSVAIMRGVRGVGRVHLPYREYRMEAVCLCCLLRRVVCLAPVDAGRCLISRRLLKLQRAQ